MRLAPAANDNLLLHVVAGIILGAALTNVRKPPTAFYPLQASSKLLVKPAAGPSFSPLPVIARTISSRTTATPRTIARTGSTRKQLPAPKQ